MESYLLGCDWGTSSFRLGLYNTARGELIDVIESTDGVSGIYRDWQNGSCVSNGITKSKFFFERLLAHINSLSKKTSISLSNIPVVISGMASSSLGIEDVPYASLPFNLDGSQAVKRKFDAQEDFPHEIFLLSGVQSRNDVMRGEETQLIGIWSQLADMGSQPEEAIIIFPGTHSKHVFIRNGEMIQFKTFMSGELYQVIGNYSILKDSINMKYAIDAVATDSMAFKKGVRDAIASNILNGLFTVRTNQLFNRLNKEENAFYLSGLLIGSELKDLKKNPGKSLFLCSGKNLFGLYKLAFEELELAERTIFISADLVEKAAMTGQKIIYDQYIKKGLLNE